MSSRVAPWMENENLVSSPISLLNMVLRMPVAILSKSKRSRAKKKDFLRMEWKNSFPWSTTDQGLLCADGGGEVDPEKPYLIFSGTSSPKNRMDGLQDRLGEEGYTCGR